jgi:exocyst complex component 1
VTDVFVVLESYITHIRIVEDAAYPSAPPPPDSNPELKKPRLIIVAVRKSGHVRMHKARENLNGTFSIGKTWPLDDLSAVESFSSSATSTPEEQQRKQWAGGVGFIVTIGKPYYWQANTQKEKQFFIASLVKIYTKYTGGKAPVLIGFEDKEKEILLGGNASQSRTQPPLVQNSASAPQPPSSAPPYQTRFQRQPPPRDGVLPSTTPDSSLRLQSQSRPLPPGAPSSYTSQAQRPSILSKREESPSSSIDYSGVTPQQSQTNLRRVAGSNQSQESFGRGDDTSSLPPRPRGGVNGLPSAAGRFQDRSVTPTSQRAMTPDSHITSGSDATSDIPPVPAPLSLPPERRRPPISASPEGVRTGRRNSIDDMIPAPLSSPSMRREETRTPVKSDDRPLTPKLEKAPEFNRSQRSDDLNIVGTPSKAESPQPFSNPGRSKSPEKAAPVTDTTTTDQDSLPTPTESFAQTPDDERPGLGPMIKKKKSRADVANTFRKAATAANAFKPRAGGAAERLREQQTKPSDGPDGITGVVPAPSLVRRVSTESTKTATPDPIIKEKPAASKINDSIPEVKITVPPPDRPSSLEGPIKSTPEIVVPEKVKTREVRRQKPTSELTQKHLGSLGIDWSMLDGKGAEFASLLDEFGWAGEGIRSRNIDQMKDDIDRELNNAQAGGWLTRLEVEDERVEAIKKGIDLCVAECDELDGLLTLYSVELGVSKYRTGLLKKILTFR